MAETKRRGRPPKTEADTERERARIAAIAGDLFQNEGVAAVSMRRLAKEAGVTPKTLYAYFGAKRDILQHIWEKFFVDLFDQIDAIAKSDASPHARLKAACLCYIDYWETNDDRYDLVFMSDSVSQSDVGLFLDDSSIVDRYAVFAELIAAASAPAAQELTPLKLNALICALDGIAHNKVTISYYDWGSSDALLDTLLPGILETKYPGK